MGVPHPDYLYELLSLDQLNEWEAYYTLNPPDVLKEDYRIAMLASLITNLMIRAHGKKSAKLTKLNDFIIDWDVTREDYVEPKKQTVEEMKLFLLNFAAKQNAYVERKQRKK